MKVLNYSGHASASAYHCKNAPSAHLDSPVKCVQVYIIPARVSADELTAPHIHD